MKTEIRIYIGLGVLAVLGGLYYMQSNRSKEHALARSETVLSESSIPQFKVSSEVADKISKLVITEKDKPTIVLEKRGEEWWLVEPMLALASQSNVKSTVDNLKAIDTKEPINDTPEAPAMYKQYDLEGEQSLHIIAYQGEERTDKVVDAFFGKSGSRGQMARLADKPGIWVVKGFASFNYTRPTKDWREKSMLKFEDANVVSIAIDNAEGKFSFSKNGDSWNGTRNKTKIARLDAEKIKDMLRAFKALNAEDFADDKKGKTDETGLGDKPTGVITIVLKDDAGTIRLVFGETSSGSSRYVKKDGDDNVYVVGSWASDWATAKVDKFQKPEGKDDSSDKSSPEPQTFDFGGGMPPGMPHGMDDGHGH